MCGILAVLGCRENSHSKRSRIIELSRRLRHRGPDWSGLHCYQDCYLAHQRLAIVDPTSGDQPLYNEDKTIAVTVNGEIYNHEELRGKLKSHQFRTGSDCEVIAHLYEEYGEELVDMLDGMFSFVLLDTRDKSFIAARDTIGITPLYMGWGLDGSIWFASEMKALSDDCERFTTFLPGHIYSSKHGELRRWYNPPWYSEHIPSTPYNPLVLREAFEKAVVKRLMTDVPFGVLLSGGLDSSLVAAVASRHLAETKVGRQWGSQLHTFCVGLEGSPDLIAAREVADYLGTFHHEFHFTVQEGIDAIEEVIYHIETYDVTTVRASTPMFLMSRKIKSLGVKMVLSGEGSDEIFGGYLYFHKAPNKEELHLETCRKIKALHLYDCLRANKSTSAWGLEARVPFLDKNFLNIAMDMDPEWKMMQVLDLEPNSSTFVSLVLGCCGSVSVLRQGLSIHGCVFKLGCDSDLLLSNSIMSMYVRFDIVDTARSLFDSMEEKSNVSWTTIMGGYLKIGDFGEVFNLFNQMQQERIGLDSITFVNLVSSCAQIGRLSMGSSIHSLVIKSGCDHEDIIATSLVSMYSKCGDLISARKKFDSMHAKSVFLWTSMIGGYVHGGHANEALNLFENLLMTGVQPNEVTLTTVLSACGYFGSLGIGKKVEEYVKASGFEYDLRVQTSLIHMYCKCGCIERAKEIFDGVSNKDLTVWSSMINAYAIHGKGEEALTLFRKMQREEGIKPDAVVFTAVLSACSHSGLVDEGLKYFCSMERDFNVEPSVEHYSCLVDLLGRAGCFSLALKTILEMPIEAQARAWAPLLSACRTYRKIQLGEYVAKRLFESDPSGTANYILMANMYASVGKWKEAAEMRRWMNDRGLVKEPGWSKIEVDGLSHVFLVGDQSHHRSVEIYEKLEELNGKLREAGYAAETDMVIHDLETEEKENSLKVHSERLAVAFGLLATETGSRLTIIKNLRTCCDCHSYLKFVSRVTGRHLIVRDGYRFHHFECGVCSCGGFW